IETIEEASDQFDGSCWPIVPITTCETAPITDWAAPCGAPEYWLSAAARLARPPPPRRPLKRLAPWVRTWGSPPAIALLSLVRTSGSELDTASETFWAPPGAAAAVPSAARIAGTAALTSFWAAASLTPATRAKLPIICGVRYCDTRLMRLIAMAAPLRPTKKNNDRRSPTRFSYVARL